MHHEDVWGRLRKSEYHVQNHLFTDLHPNSRYEVIVQSRNHFGWSEPTKSFIFTTRLRGEEEDFLLWQILKLVDFFGKAKVFFVPFRRSSKENVVPGAIDVVVEVGGLIKDPDENTDFFQGRSTPNCPSQIVAVPKQPLGRAVDSSNLRFAYGKSKLNVCFSLFN